MNNIFLLRHGTTVPNLSNITQPFDTPVSLTDEAYEQTRQNAERFCSKLHGDIVVLTSPQLRAMQTCDIVVHELLCNMQTKAVASIQVQQIPELHEVNFGDFGGQTEGFVIDGCTMQDYRQATIDYYVQRRQFKFPNGESVSDIVARTAKIAGMLKSYVNTDKTVIVVGHNRMFRHLLVQLGCWQPQSMFKHKLPHAKLYQCRSV